MKNKHEIEPIDQTGHNCKSTAIAAVDQFYAKKIGFQPIPLHKRKKHPISKRELAKKNGSIQGELLEIKQIPKILEQIGYETELVNFENNFSLFKKTIIENINAGNLIFACFAVDRITGNPTNKYDQYNEHAAILNGYNEESDVLEIVHWNKQRTTSLKDFYNSSMVLPNERQPEYYEKVKHKNKRMKYDLTKEQNDDSLKSGVKKSIIPEKNSGFCGKLVIIKQPELKNILEVRKKLLQDNPLKIKQNKINKLFKTLKTKTNEIIEKSSTDSEYENAKLAAIILNNALDDARSDYFKSRLSDPKVFYKACNLAIKNAELEFKTHRGWHQLNPIFRGFLGILSTITVVPALIVSSVTKHGYLGTFFKTPRTDSSEKLAQFQKDLEKELGFESIPCIG